MSERDYDMCERKGCDHPAMVGSPWMMDYCTPECRAQDQAGLEQDAESERQYEIQSGGQG